MRGGGSLGVAYMVVQKYYPHIKSTIKKYQYIFISVVMDGPSSEP